MIEYVINYMEKSHLLLVILKAYSREDQSTTNTPSCKFQSYKHKLTLEFNKRQILSFILFSLSQSVTVILRRGKIILFVNTQNKMTCPFNVPL